MPVRKMDLNPEDSFNLNELASSDKSLTDLQPLSEEFHADGFACSLSHKRKWDDEAVDSSVAYSNVDLLVGNSSRDEDTTSGVLFAAKDSHVGKRHTAKRIKTMNRKEMNVLRIQIAMISDMDGDRPIHVAVAQDNLKLVRKLCNLMLKSTISVDLTNFLRQTPLHLAVMLGNTDMVELLLEHGASIVLRDRNGNSVLHLAVKTKACENIFDLILHHPDVSSILNSLDNEGYSALHYAVMTNNETAVSCLKNSGVWMNIVDGKSGRTPLIHAVMERNDKMVNLLLQVGASVEVTDYSGRTALELAVQSSNRKIAKLLEKKMLTENLSERTSKESQQQNSLSRTRTEKRWNLREKKCDFRDDS